MSRPDALGITRTPVWLWALLAVQIALLVAITVLDFGWRDQAGSSGLRVDHRLIGAFLYAVLVTGGIGWAIVRRSWAVLAAEILAPVVALLWMSGALTPPLTAADNQDLIGMTEEQATAALDERGGSWTGTQGDDRGIALTYKGIFVYLEDGRRITRIVPGRDPVPTAEWPPLVAAEQQDVVGMPYRAGYDTLTHRRGIDYGTEHDASGDYLAFNGVRVYFGGVQRVVRVTPSDY